MNYWRNRMSIKSTEITQNIIHRAGEEMGLEREFYDSGKKSVGIKRKFAEVRKTFIDLSRQLDELNDMKFEFRGKN